MDFEIPLDEMTTEDKLAAMEQLWEDLCRNSESIPSLQWHGDVLSARERQTKEGKAKFSTLDEVKGRIQKLLT